MSDHTLLWISALAGAATLGCAWFIARAVTALHATLWEICQLMSKRDEREEEDRNARENREVEEEARRHPDWPGE